MPTLTIELTDNERARLAELAQSRGVDAPECARALLRPLLTDPYAAAPNGRAAPSSDPPQGATNQRPIWMRAVEAGEALPAEERTRTPRDGAVNVDHYVYGLPKRT